MLIYILRVTTSMTRQRLRNFIFKYFFYIVIVLVFELVDIAIITVASVDNNYFDKDKQDGYGFVREM